MTVAAVDRAFLLLRTLPTSEGTLSALARDTDLPVATVARLMASLEAAGAVHRADKAYRIGPTIMELATAEPAAYDLLSVATTHLNELATTTNETAGIAQGVGTDLVHLGQVATEHDVAVKDWTGFRVAAHSGCIGFVMMAHWSITRLDDYLSANLEQFVEHTVVDPKTIRERLEHIRSAGTLWTTDEYALGVTTVAAPIFDRSGSAVAALHVHGPSFRFPATGTQTSTEKALKDRAAAISAVLGHKKLEQLA